MYLTYSNYTGMPAVVAGMQRRKPLSCRSCHNQSKDGYGSPYVLT
jgi:hypothetical protein